MSRRSGSWVEKKTPMIRWVSLDRPEDRRQAADTEQRHTAVWGSGALGSVGRRAASGADPGGWGSPAQLLTDAEVVAVGPVLADSAVSHPEPVGLSNRERPAAGREHRRDRGVRQVGDERSGLARPDIVACTTTRSPSWTTSCTCQVRSLNAVRSHSAVANMATRCPGCVRRLGGGLQVDSVLGVGRTRSRRMNPIHGMKRCHGDSGGDVARAGPAGGPASPMGRWRLWAGLLRHGASGMAKLLGCDGTIW